MNLGLREPIVDGLPFPFPDLPFPLGGNHGFVHVVAFISSFAFAFVHSSLPSSFASRRIDLELTNFFAFGSGVIAFRMKSALVTTDIGIVLSVFLQAVACLEFCYLEMRVACKACVIEE